MVLNVRICLPFNKIFEFVYQRQIKAMYLNIDFFIFVKIQTIDKIQTFLYLDTPNKVPER